MNRKTMLVILTLTALLIGPVLAGVSTVNRNTVQMTTMSLVADDYVPHAPILIASDADFESQGWSGDGTVEDPYVIEGLSIEVAHDQAYGIEINNVQSHFVVKYCYLHGVSYRSAIRLQFAMNGIIEHNQFNVTGGGISVLDSSEIIVRENNVTTDTVGGTTVYFCRTENSTIAENLCFNGDIYLHKSSNNNTIVNNTASWIVSFQFGGGSILSSNNTVKWNVFNGTVGDWNYENASNFFDYNWYLDYEAIDLNTDGIGDLPFNSNGIIDMHPLVELRGFEHQLVIPEPTTTTSTTTTTTTTDDGTTDGEATDDDQLPDAILGIAVIGAVGIIVLLVLWKKR